MPTVASIHVSRAEWNEAISGPQSALSTPLQDSYRPASTSPLFMTMAAGCGLGIWAGHVGCAVGALALPLLGCDSDFRLQAEPTPQVTPPLPPDPEKCEEVTITVDCDGDGFTNTFSVCEDDAWVVVTACGGETLPSDEEDCAPQNPEAYPGAPEIACSGADENCDGLGDQEWIALDSVSPSASLSASETQSDPDAAPYFGEAISTGDLNGDGASDLMVSSMGNVHIFYGPVASDAKEDVTMMLASDEVPKTSALDFNGDGYDDLAVFAWPDGATSRKIFMIPGPLPQGTTGVDIVRYAVLTFVDDSEYQPYDQDMSAVGDLNFDDRDDLIMTNTYDASYIIYGRDFPSQSTTLALSEDSDATRFNTDFLAGDSFYNLPDFYSLSAAGDLNNDGYRDILIAGSHLVFDAESGEDWQQGHAYLLYGPFSMGAEHVLDEGNMAVLELNVVEEFEEYEYNAMTFGDSLAGLGDVNRDGFDDVMIGFPEGNVPGSTELGLAYLVLGGDDLYGTRALEDVALTLIPPSDPDDFEKTTRHFASILAPVGDVNGDFLADAAIYVWDLAKSNCLSEDVSPYSGLIVLYGLPFSAEELRGQSRSVEDLAGTVYYDDLSYKSLIQAARIYPREIAMNPGLFDGSPKSLIFPSYQWFVVDTGSGETSADPEQIQVFNNINP